MKLPTLTPFGVFLVAATASLLLPGTALADLKYDVRLVSTGGKAAVVTVGQAIQFYLYAQVTGVGAGDEGFQSGVGSILSSQGGNIRGNLSATLLSPFNQSGSQTPAAQDLDGDGDIDLGTNATVYDASIYNARAASPQYTSTDDGNGNLLYTSIPNGTEFRLARFTFTVTSILSLTDATPINLFFRTTTFTSNTAEAIWYEDGGLRNANGIGGGQFPTVTASIQLSAVPEPASACLLGVAGIMLAGRRRSRRVV